MLLLPRYRAMVPPYQLTVSELPGKLLPVFVCEISTILVHPFSVASTAVSCKCSMYALRFCCSLFDRVVWSQSSLSDHRPMFVLVSLFLVCLLVFPLLLSAEYHNVLICSSLCGPHNFSNYSNIAHLKFKSFTLKMRRQGFV